MKTPPIDPKPRGWARYWPWALLLMLTTPAIWHDLSFPGDLDGEFPKVVRPTFSAHPPPAYRLAEPGDTIDRVAIYVSSIAVVFSGYGLIFARENRRLRVAALAISLTALWYSATPGPTFDGWHGSGFRAIGDPTAPPLLRIGLAGVGIGLLGLLAFCLGVRRDEWVKLWGLAKSREVAGLLLVSCLLTVWRLTSFPDVEPLGYWPRWAFVWALVAFTAVLLRLAPRTGARKLTLAGMSLVSIGCWYGLVVGGIWLTWYHRPLERLRTVVPGRIYMSAMPTARGLEIAQRRHRFKTIINLFPEDTPQRSPRFDEELRFAREHGLTYVLSPSDISSSNAFLDKTLTLATDPNSWPILVHCHACMDRTPAWVGIYRFVVEGRPLDDVMRFIEGHRGYRPKASVTLLYNRVLPRLAPERAKNDPTACLLGRCAEGTTDPYYNELSNELGKPDDRANPSGLAVSEANPRPSLTPPR